MAGVQVHSDAFLSERLGREAFNVILDEVCDEARFAAFAGEYLAREDIFLSCKIPSDAVRLAGLLETSGFRLVDSNVSFRKPTSPGRCRAWPGTIRRAEPGDEAAVRAIAARELVRNRFHLDPLIPASTAARLKSDWAGNYFNGLRGEAMVVAERDGAVAGFLQLLVRDAALIIDLIAVDGAQRRQGAAAAMIAHAETSFPDCTDIRVGTQLVNTASINFYCAQGFGFSGSSYVFHHHGARK